MAGSGKGRKTRSLDWPKVKLRYLTDPTATLRGVAREFSINFASVQRRSTAEGWVAEKKKAQAEIASAVVQKTVSDLSAFVTAQATEALEDLGRARRAILAAYVAQATNPDSEPEPYEINESEEAPLAAGGLDEDCRPLDPSEPRLRSRYIRKRRPQVDGKFAAEILKAEAELLVAFTKPATDGESGTRTIEIT